MEIFRVEKTKGYTVMSNHHLKNKKLSLKAKGLMSLMLSLPENWDYTLKGLASISLEGVDAIRKGVQELQNAGYIECTRIRNQKGQFISTSYVLHENPECSSISSAKNVPQQEKSPQSGKLSRSMPADRENKFHSGTEETSEASTASALFSYDACKKMVKNNLDYEIMCEMYDPERMDDIVNLITEILCSNTPSITISGQEYPSEMVKERFLKFNSMHLRYVFECMDQSAKRIGNIKAYLLTTLFNAPSTLASYYTARVHQDFNAR